MKKLLLILIAFILIGCNQVTATTKVVKVDGCDYVIAVQSIGNSGSVSIVHKANCNNH